METVKLTKQAADCLAWFVDHPFYGDTLSEVIVDLTREWAAREHTSLEEMCVEGEYKRKYRG